MSAEPEIGDHWTEKARMYFSGVLTIFSLIIITLGIWTETNKFFEGVHPILQTIILTLDIILLAMLEGVQISLVSLKNHPNEAYRITHPRAFHISSLIHRNQNLERFLMGRQIFVVITVFIAARLTGQEGTKFFGLDIPFGFEAALMNTGLLGVVVIAIFGQLTPQIVASAYPVEFMQIIPGHYQVCWMCLAFESLGLVHFNYLVADFYIWLFGIKSKEESKEVMEGTVGKMSTGNKLEALSDVLDKISTSQTVSSEAAIMENVAAKYPAAFAPLKGKKSYATPDQVYAALKSNGYSGAQPGYTAAPGSGAYRPAHIQAVLVLAQNASMLKALAKSGKKADVEASLSKESAVADAAIRMLQTEKLGM